MKHFPWPVANLRQAGSSSHDASLYSCIKNGTDIARFIDNVIGQPVVLSGHSSGGELQPSIVSMMSDWRAQHPTGPVTLPWIPHSWLATLYYNDSYDLLFGEAFYDGSWMEGVDQEHMLQSISCPVTYLKANTKYGDDGMVHGANSDEDAERVQALIPHCQTVRIESGPTSTPSTQATSSTPSTTQELARNHRTPPNRKGSTPMTTLIAYATKTGTTEKAARLLAARIPHAICVNLATDAPRLEDCDGIIIGGPIRMGALHKSVAAFIQDNREALQAKRYGLFICCGFADQAADTLAAVLDEPLRAGAVAVSSFGGELDLAKQKGLGKMVVKMVTKANPEAPAPCIDEEAIEAFARTWLS